MRGADVVRAQQDPLRIEPRFGQVSQNGSEVVVSDNCVLCHPPPTSCAEGASVVPLDGLEVSGAEVAVGGEQPSDVLEEPDGRARLDKDTNGVRPEVSRVVDAKPFPGLGERLAGEAAGDDVDAPAPGGAVEPGDVGVDGEGVDDSSSRTACSRNGLRSPCEPVELPQLPAFGVGHDRCGYGCPWATVAVVGCFVRPRQVSGFMWQKSASILLGVGHCRAAFSSSM